jgi:DNA polymerase V
MRESCFAVVDANNFYASCERLFRPDLLGKPIVVLSSQDGCVIARSNEARALGIAMSTPYYQIKSLCIESGVFVFSSNFALYGDLSNRLMSIIESMWPEVELYSIDEAFLDLSQMRHPLSLASSICQRIKQHIGIPVSIGIGPSKTLAKAANYIAKRMVRRSVFDLSSSRMQSKWLPQVPVGEVWGVGHCWAKRLQEQGIHDAWALRCLPIAQIKNRFNQSLVRTVLELRGAVCGGLSLTTSKKSILCSRSFPEPISSIEPISEALSHFCVRACEKLRAQKSVASRVTVFLRTSPHGRGAYYSQQASCVLPYPTDDTSRILAVAQSCLCRVYVAGHPFRKTGVLLSDLSSSQTGQIDCFQAMAGGSCSDHRDKLMSVIDQMNSRWGRGTIRFASEGSAKTWLQRAAWRSKRYTTAWSELPEVH